MTAKHVRVTLFVTAVGLLAMAGLLLLPALPSAASAHDDPPVPPRGCEWQWDGAVWELKVFLCAPMWCHPPDRAGAFVGETVYTPCATTPPPPPPGCQGCGN